MDTVQVSFSNVDKRFEDLIHQMDKRFKGIDKRFEDVNKRFNLITWLTGIGFTSVNILVIILKFFIGCEKFVR